MRKKSAVKKLQRGVRGRLEGGRPKEPMVAVGLVGLAVAQAADQNDFRPFQRTTSTAEELLSAGDPAIDELVVVGFIEGMLNAASHAAPDRGESLRAQLPPRCAQSWDEIAAKLADTERWMRVSYQSMPMAADAPTGLATELDQLFRINYWESPTGALVGVADVLGYETDLVTRAERGFS